jgi:SPP1 gp7 family putative phage head morphogenesis protein
MTSLADVSLIKGAVTANQEIFNRAVRHAVFFERFSNGQQRKLVGFLQKRLIPDIEDKLTKRLSMISAEGAKGHVRIPMRTRHLSATLAQLDATVRTRLRQAGSAFAKNMRKFALSEAEWQRATMQGAVPDQLNISFTKPDFRQLSRSILQNPYQGKRMNEWFKDLSSSTRTGVRGQVAMGMLQGEGTAEIARRVKGVLKTTTRKAEAVARTTTNHVAAQAREQVFAENSHLIKGVRWVSTLDDRTTQICAGLDGRVFRVGEGIRPPAHVRCRSATTPVLHGVERGDRATRASMNGQVPAKTTYGQWLKGQPPAVQDAVLGKGRAKLFRQGKIDITRFTDSKQNVLTLKQLEQVEARLAGKTLGPLKLRGTISAEDAKALGRTKFPAAGAATPTAPKRPPVIPPRVGPVQGPPQPKPKTARQIAEEWVDRQPLFDKTGANLPVNGQLGDEVRTAMTEWAEHHNAFLPHAEIRVRSASYFRTRHGRQGSQVYAHATRPDFAGNAYVELNSRWWGTKGGTATRLRGARKQGFDAGWSVNGQPRGTIIHELGHVTDHVSAISPISGQARAYAVRRPPTAKDLSTYGTRNESETFAEAFSAAWHKPWADRSPWLQEWSLHVIQGYKDNLMKPPAPFLRGVPKSKLANPPTLPPLMVRDPWGNLVPSPELVPPLRAPKLVSPVAPPGVRVLRTSEGKLAKAGFQRIGTSALLSAREKVRRNDWIEDQGRTFVVTTTRRIPDPAGSRQWLWLLDLQEVR